MLLLFYQTKFNNVIAVRDKEKDLQEFDVSRLVDFGKKHIDEQYKIVHDMPDALQDMLLGEARIPNLHHITRSHKCYLRKMEGKEEGGWKCFKGNDKIAPCPYLKENGKQERQV